MALHVIVLAGGSGTRLWPMSRAAVPKHLLPLGPGGVSLLRATVDRVLPLGGAVHVVTVASQADACAAELSGLDGVEVIAEPMARGTGPALGLVVRRVAADDPDAVMCSVHADHHVGDDEAYRAALWAGAGWAVATAGLATVGVVPSRPATGFGYVALGAVRRAGEWRQPAPEPPGLGQLVATAGSVPAYAANGFVEKPPIDVARAFVAAGSHLWNTGLFAWTARAFERELAVAPGGIAEGIDAVVRAGRAGDEDEVQRRYRALPTVAVDPLILERTRRLTVVAAAFPWSDLGSWGDLLDARVGAGQADAGGNVLGGDALVEGSRGCLVDGRGGRLVAVVGGHDLVVVDTGDAVLVVPRDRVQDVRCLVERLRREGRIELL